MLQVKEKENLVELAYQLMHDGTSKEDVRAAQDVEEINLALEKGQKFTTYLQLLDGCLRKRHDIIEFATKPWALCVATHDICNMENEELLRRLIEDKQGILAELLLRHGVVESIDDLCA